MEGFHSLPMNHPMLHHIPRRAAHSLLSQVRSPFLDRVARNYNQCNVRALGYTDEDIAVEPLDHQGGRNSHTGEDIDRHAL